MVAELDRPFASTQAMQPSMIGDSPASPLGMGFEASLEAAGDLQLLLQTLYQLYERSRAERAHLEQHLTELAETCSQLRVALEQQRHAASRAAREAQQLQAAAQVQTRLAELIGRSQAAAFRSAAWRSVLDDSAPVAGNAPLRLVNGDALTTEASRGEYAEPLPFSPRGSRAAAAAAVRSAPHTHPDSPLGSTTLVVLRVPDARTAQALHQAVAALPGIARCSLQAYEAGRLVFDVGMHDGVTLEAAVGGLSMVDLRSLKSEPGALVLQWL